MINGKKALLLDMNGTFMFGEDRFSEGEDFSIHYAKIGGTLAPAEINRIIRAAYHYLDSRYPDERYRHDFPSLKTALSAVIDQPLGDDETHKIIDTFVHHELGHIPDEYASALHALHSGFTLAAVIDIWAPKAAWLQEFERAGIADLFTATSFSSDHGMVKPSAKPYEQVLQKLGLTPSEALVIGDSPRRDLGGAQNAGIDCVLVGGAVHPDAVASAGSLLELCIAF